MTEVFLGVLLPEDTLRAGELMLEDFLTNLLTSQSEMLLF